MTGARLLDHWSPPEGAGAPVACLATTFSFGADFFAQDCLSRFLSLSTVAGEGDSISSVAAVLEEEDRLSEAEVSVVVDRSSPAEKRNLRWDLLPVAARGGLLHAKVAVLLWERSGRIILGSANLTSAGYRTQVEVALAIDLHDGCQVPVRVIDDLVAELRRLVALAPASQAPTRRAMGIVDRLAARAAALDLPRSSSPALRVAVAPARPGVGPLDRLAEVWRGGQPLRATWLSPFWDDDVPAPAVEAVRRRLTGRPASRRGMTLVAAVDPYTGCVQGPSSLASQHGAKVVAFDPLDTELRRLHAKLLLVESDDWVATLVGSSNATTAGFGLDPRRGHQELNLWVGCPADSPTAKHLRALARTGSRITLDDERWEAVEDEDEPTAPVLPLGFVSCTLDAAPRAKALVVLEPDELPWAWVVRTPAGHVLLTADVWRANGTPEMAELELPDEVLPSYLCVAWEAAGEPCQATWTANVEDRATLPAPAELRELPVDVLLAALASTRPLPLAVERELRRRERVGGDGDASELDPLRRFDDSGLLLQRVRHLSLALWRLQDRLGRPATNLDALHWRLHGAFGPLAIADALVSATREEHRLPGEAQFLLAELALTVAAVDWRQAAPNIEHTQVQQLVADVIAAIAEKRRDLPPSSDAALDGYVLDALEAARP